MTITPTQADIDCAEAITSAANIVTCDGYYEIDIDAVTALVAAHAQATREEAAIKIDGSDGRIPFSTIFVSLMLGHNQPCMSGDMRDRLNPHQRWRFDNACRTLATAIRAKKEGRDDG